MNTKLELKHYRLIEAMSRFGSLASCASELFLTQSALSHQLREMERRLGYRLVDRNGNVLSLNEAGLRLLRTANAILPEVERAEQDCSLIARGMAGRVVISTESPRFFRRLPEILTNFHNEFPSVPLNIAINGNRKPVTSLRNHAIDLAIISTVFVEFPVHIQPLYEEDWIVIMPTDHPMRNAGYFPIQAFADENLITYATDPENNYVLREIILAHGVTPKSLTQIEVTEGIVELVKGGHGVAVMAEWTCRNEIDAGQLQSCPLTEIGTRRSWNAVTRAEDQDGGPIQIFTDYLVKSFEALRSEQEARAFTTTEI